MPAPIVVGQRPNPMGNFLMQLYLNKIRHNQTMDIADKRLQAEKLRIEEQRTYQEKQTLAREERAKGNKVATENRAEVKKYRGFGWQTEDEIVDPNRKLHGTTKMVGGKLMYYPRTPNETETHAPVWEKNRWKMVKKESLKAYVNPNNPKDVVYRKPQVKPPEGYVPYSSPLVTINTKPSIGEKSRQQTEAFLKTPKFRSSIINDVKRIRGRMWDIMEPQEQEALIKQEADIRVKNTFPGATYGINESTGEVGWFVKEGNSHKLVTPWSK